MALAKSSGLSASCSHSSPCYVNPSLPTVQMRLNLKATCIPEKETLSLQIIELGNCMQCNCDLARRFISYVASGNTQGPAPRFVRLAVMIAMNVRSVSLRPIELLCRLLSLLLYVGLFDT